MVDWVYHQRLNSLHVSQWPPQYRLHSQVSGKRPAEARWLMYSRHCTEIEREERHVFRFHDSIFHGNTSREDTLCIGRGDVFSQSMNISIPQNKSILFIFDITSTLVLVVSWVLRWVCVVLQWLLDIDKSQFFTLQSRIKSQERLQSVISTLVRPCQEDLGSRWVWSTNQVPVSKSPDSHHQEKEEGFHGLYIYWVTGLSMMILGWSCYLWIFHRYWNQSSESIGGIPQI